MRIVVTGMGVVSPIGIGTDQFWTAAINGVSGIRRVSSFDASSRRSQVAGEVPGFDPKTFLSAKIIEQTDRFSQLALLAAKLAVEDAGGLDAYSPPRVAVSIGSGMGGFSTFESSALAQVSKSTRTPVYGAANHGEFSRCLDRNQIWVERDESDLQHGMLFRGKCHWEALDLLRTGRADAVIAGGAEACVLPLTMNRFEILHALTTGFNNDPTRASRPFAKGRDGFVMSEGAGILILEEEEHASSRGAKIYACLAGYGQACDAAHIVMPDLSGQVAAMEAAIEDAGMANESVEYINAHATSTPLR